MTKLSSMVAMLLLAASVTAPARAQEARKPDPPPASAPAAKPVDPSEEQKRQTARELLLKGGSKPAADSKARSNQSVMTAASATGAGVNNARSPSAQPAHPVQPVVYIQQPAPQAVVDPVAEAHAEHRRLETEAYRRQMDRDDAFALSALAHQDEALRQQQMFAEQHLAAGWQALDTDLANQYQGLAYQDQALAANQIGLQSAVTANRQQYFAYKSGRQWDNHHRAYAVIGGLDHYIPGAGGLGAGLLNYGMRGHEDRIDQEFEGQFNQQQSDMLTDIDASRRQQVEVRDELRNNLRMRMEALKARQDALRAR